MRADNTAHLRAAVARRQRNTQHRAQTVLAELQAAAEPLTVAKLAKMAGVARSWIYTQPELLQQIRQQHPAERRRPPAAASDASWQQRLEVAHQRIRDLTAENKKLRDQLAKAHGALRAHQATSTTTRTASTTRNTP
jgi:hypothetical protein